jgi:glutathione peroxidase
MNLKIKTDKVMKKIFLLFSILMMTLTVFAQDKTIYDFKVTDIDGHPFDMASLKGKKVLIVNTASKCGFTPQYKQLEAIYRKYGPDKFVIVGFPANNFMHQEPGTNSQIKTFCTEKYDVTFPMMSKISVKGDDMAPIYKWLTEKSQNGVMDAPIKWNFQKFMIDKTGHLAGVAWPQDKPDSPKIVNWIEGKN